MAEDKDKTEPTPAKDTEKGSAEEVKKTPEVKAEAEAAKPTEATEEAKTEAKAAKPAEATEEVKTEAKAAKKPAEATEEVKADAKAAKKPAEATEEVKAEEEPKRETAADILATDVPAPIKAAPKGKKARVVPVGVAHVRATFNNTMVSITDTHGGVISWSSAGKAGFKGSRKSTAFAGTLVAQDAARQAMSRGMKEVEIRVQGAGAGRESAVRAIQSVGLSVSVIKDVTPIPHNGCRPRKRRRV